MLLEPVLPRARQAVDEDDRRRPSPARRRSPGRPSTVTQRWCSLPVDVHPRRAADRAVVAGRVGQAWGSSGMHDQHNRRRRASPHAHRHRHRLHPAPLLGPARRRRQAPLRRRPALRRAAHVEDHAPARRAAARRDRRHPLRRRDRRARARTRTRSRSSTPGTRRATHPHHQPPRRALPRRHASAGCAQIGLRYDELHCSYDKVTRCGELGIDVLIDDSPVNLARALEARHRRRDDRASVEHRRLRGGGRIVCADDWPGLARALELRCRGCARGMSASARRRDRRAIAAPRSPRRRGLAERRPAPLPAGRRARAPGRRLGPLGARRGRPRPHAGRVLLPPVVPLRGRGHRERPRRGRRPAGLQPLRRAAARRGDDRQGDQGGARAPAPGAPDRRALLQGLPGLQHAAAEDRRRARAPGQRPSPALRRATARARLPRGPQGHREALQGPLPAAPLRPRRLRRGGDARPRADRPDRGRRAPRRRRRSSPRSSRCSA